MLVVSDTTPLHYLILIDADVVLPTLFGKILLPTQVIDELTRSKTPPKVSAWATQPPSWLSIMAGDESRFPFLDRGEAAALALAVELQADLILADDREARTMAKSLGIKTIGTIGILAEAHRATLVDFDQAIDELRQTNFHIQDSVIAGVRERLAKEPISINQIP